MQICLYSPRGGFYSTRANKINAEFGTSPTSHPLFGTLIAKQLKQMWEILEFPSSFQVIEVGSGDGALARSIVDEIQLLDSDFSDALQYVATDYEPWWPDSLNESLGWDGEAQNSLSLMYANGEGVPEDDAEAVKWYRLAADQGDAYAQFNLGVMYDWLYSLQ